MVLAERNPELVRNGRRSRGPSPNGHGPSSGSTSGPSGGQGGTGTPDTSSDDDNSIKRNGKTKSKQSEYEEKIRVGRDYQAIVPPLVPEPERKPECLNDRALLVWAPTKEIPDSKLEEYISVAKEKYGYNGEQALGMLFWHKHDLERAVMDLANFTPFPDEWTQEDKVLFEQAFQFHGKSFHRIRQMLPDKSIASLVKYYYSWKKTRHRQSVMDRQEKVKANKDGSSDNGSDNASDESDNEDKEQSPLPSTNLLDQTNSTSAPNKLGSINNSNAHHILDVDSNVSSTSVNNKQQQSLHILAPVNITDSIIKCNGITEVKSNVNQINNECGNAVNMNVSGGGGCCFNCGVVCNFLNTSPHGKLCASCYHHWRRTGNKRPTSGPYFGKRSRDRSDERLKRKPPRGMYINHDDIVALASTNDYQGELLANIDREIVSLLSQVQLNKQNISSLKHKNSDNFDDIHPSDNSSRINARWTNDECLLVVEGVRKYGKDFQTIAEAIGTKTEAHVRTFYMNNRRRYNLDQVLKKYEIEKDTAASSSTGACSSISVATNCNDNNLNNFKKDESQIKKKDFPSVLTNEDSDNTTSSENATITSKSTTITTVSAEERKLESTNIAKDDSIVEIDLNDDLLDDNLAPLAKRIALSVANQDISKSRPI